MLLGIVDQRLPAHVGAFLQRHLGGKLIGIEIQPRHDDRVFRACVIHRRTSSFVFSFLGQPRRSTQSAANTPAHRFSKLEP